VFARADILPVSLAWDAFGANNGAASLLEMRKRIAYYRNQTDDFKQDYAIGCRILTQPFFLPENQWIPVPASWSPYIQQGRTYDTSHGDGRHLWDAIMERETQQATAPISIPRFGEPTLVRPRLGQGAFRVGVTDIYHRRCAVTGERTLPILDAAHIRPYGQGGEHDITNGLLLRTDIHRLFDLGYVTVTGEGKFEVGRRLNEDFENGKYYYAMHGRPIFWPEHPEHQPKRELLEWHQANSFLG
jgi:putative restriction endonuclease